MWAAVVEAVAVRSFVAFVFVFCLVLDDRPVFDAREAIGAR